jgi:hypothetical protein
VDAISIFDGVVRHENEHSRLLCNLLNRSRAFRCLVYYFLADVELGEDDFVANPQVDFLEEGRPDIEICFRENPSKSFFVETKTERDCTLTPPQKAGYGSHDKLRYIVPAGWKHASHVQNVSGIRLWNKLVSLIEQDAELQDDPLFREYRLLIDRKFPSIRLRHEEVQLIERSENIAVLISLARKMHRAIDALYEHFNGSSIDANKLTIVFDKSSDDQYGFDIKAADRKLLWVGMWSGEGQWLCAAYDMEWPQSKHVEGFSKAKSEHEYEVLPLSELFSNQRIDIVSEVVERLQPILKKMLAI